MRRGAFTGAISQRRGRFERADKGTIFLDEIGELPPQAQVRLLHVLQKKEIERVGGTSSIPVDIRIISATHRNLEEMIASGRFREDLWFRLNVFPIMIPPLRQRKEKYIPALVHHLIDRKSTELKLTERPMLAPSAIDRLIAYDWPGNVRELANMIERALIRHRGGGPSFQAASPRRFPEVAKWLRTQGEIKFCLRWTRSMPGTSGEPWRRLLAKSTGQEELPKSSGSIQTLSGNGCTSSEFRMEGEAGNLLAVRNKELPAKEKSI